ncbi:MAG: TldD/PmbA family protein [Armatimonadota bacterium]|nr:TldD/PmbA family protein [bacterium]
MIDTDALKTLCRTACEAAIAAGADFVDAGASSGKSLSVEMESGSIISADAKLGGSISVRAIYKGGTGWSSSDLMTVDAAAEAGANAARLAKLAEPDPDFISLPQPSASYPQIDGLFDPALAELDIKAVIGYALANIDGARLVDPEAIVGGKFSACFGPSALVNSLGVSLATNSSYLGGYTMVVVKRGEDVGSFYDFDSARMLSDFEPEGIGAKAAAQAIKFLGARKMETKRIPIILGPLASGSVFESVVSCADAEGVQRGRSFMAGRLGERIGSDILTITDEPLIPRGLGSRSYDSEGFPCRPLTIVENGVLKSYIYGSYTAGKAKVANTGHGSRGGGASSSNVIPRLGNMTSEEIIKSTQEGLYINMGGISPNGSTGDVSSSVDFGFKIENGELAYPVASSLVGGNFLDMLKKIDAISSDYREEPGAVMPTVRIQDVLVAGGR